MKPWASMTRDQKLIVGTIAVTVLGVVCAVATPEVRRFIGLEKPRQEIAVSPQSFPASQTPPLPIKKAPVLSNEPRPLPKIQKPIRKAVTAPVVQSGNANQQTVGSVMQQGGQTQTCVGSNCVQGNNYAPQVINHFGPPALTMTDVQQAAIRDAMKPFAGFTVTIACDQATKDSREYAEKLANGLKDAGLTVNGPSNGMFFWQGTPPSGPSIQVGEDRIAAATTLGTVMRDSHLTNAPLPGSKRPERDAFQIIIRPN